VATAMIIAMMQSWTCPHQIKNTNSQKTALQITCQKGVELCLRSWNFGSGNGSGVNLSSNSY